MGLVLLLALRFLLLRVLLGLVLLLDLLFGPRVLLALVASPVESSQLLFGLYLVLGHWLLVLGLPVALFNAIVVLSVGPFKLVSLPGYFHWLV